jgi:carboxyl-terminal processing protease
MRIAMNLKEVSILVAGMLLGAILLYSAIGLADKSTTTPALVHNQYKKLNIFASVLSYIENDYVDPIDENTLIYGAIQGMISKLDPYTAFMSPEQYRDIIAETSGEHGGPGLEISLHNKRVIVSEVILDGPTYRAGIKVGDQISHINRKPVSNQTLPILRQWLRGRPGTRLKLWLTRTGWQSPREIAVIREQIRIQSVEAKSLATGFLYVRIKSFQDRTARQLNTALQHFQKQSQGKINGLVIDLRNNLGGLFNQSVRVADMFLSKVAGAMQDHRRALLLGQPSFGKGSVQTIIDLADGSGLKMTVARYYTPLERMIHKHGIHPDVIISQQGTDQHDPLPTQALRYLQNPKLYHQTLGRGIQSAHPPK